jgi:hypothetical protein
VKTEGEIRQKLKQVLFRHRKTFVQGGLEVAPVNCVHNEPMRLPVAVAESSTVGVCQFVGEDGTPNNRICDSNFGGDRQANRCPFYACRNTAADLKETFRADLELDGSPLEVARIAKMYPDVIALMWTLDEGARPENSILRFFADEDEDD